MADLARVVVNWTGNGIVGLAVNVLYYKFVTTVPTTAALRSAYTPLMAVLPSDVHIVIPTSGDVIDSATGALKAVWGGAAAANVDGVGSTTKAAGVGSCIGWQTAGIVNARKVRGRTFLAPLSMEAYDIQGTLSATGLSASQGSAAGFLAAGDLCVWHRPTSPGAADGEAHSVIASRVRDKVAYLSSRRD